MMCLEHHLTLSLSGNSFLPEELRVMCAKNVWYPAKIAALERFFTSAFFLDSCVLIRTLVLRKIPVCLGNLAIFHSKK